MTLGEVVSVHVGEKGVLSKAPMQNIKLDIDGIVGDRHRGFARKCWDANDKQVGGTLRRNERQWSAIAQEDLEEITEKLQLSEPLKASSVGVNICLKGIPNFSRLPRGTMLEFTSGAKLMVEEYNPPCSGISNFIAGSFSSNCNSGLSPTSFSSASKFTRGLVGVVEVPGIISIGDSVAVLNEKLPKWLRDPD